jgi:hypothetical protein
MPAMMIERTGDAAAMGFHRAPPVANRFTREKKEREIDNVRRVSQGA